MANNNNQLSFIGEQVKINANWHNNINEDFLRKNIRRIFNDITQNKMLEQEYYYLANPTVLNILYREAFDKYSENLYLYDVCNFYNRSSSYRPSDPGMPIDIYRIKGSKLIGQFAANTFSYKNMVDALTAIMNGVMPQQAFVNLRGSNIKF